MPEQTEQALKKQMDQQEFSKVYMLYGEEKFLLSKAARKLMDAIVGDHYPDFNLQKFDGTTASVDQIALAVEALPFLAERKCVAVSDFNVETRSPQEVKKLLELMEGAPESTVFIFYLPSVSLDYKKSAKWKSFYGTVNRWAVTVDFGLRTKSDLEKLLSAAAGKRGCQLSRVNAGRIIDQCGNDLQTLYHELEKVCAFVKEGEITRQHIEQMVTKNLETTVFLLSKALVAGKRPMRSSISCLHKMRSLSAFWRYFLPLMWICIGCGLRCKVDSRFPSCRKHLITRGKSFGCAMRSGTELECPWKCCGKVWMFCFRPM